MIGARTAAAASSAGTPARRTLVVLVSVTTVAACALVYELLAATLASYVLGDTIAQFSIVIGLYLFAMGVGAWLSKALVQSPLRRFLEIELLLALVGGLSAPALLLGFAHGAPFRGLLYLAVALVGTLVGLELPLLMRMLREEMALKDVVARALGFDYVGALVASLLFPAVLMPTFGVVRTSVATGLVNCGVALAGTVLLRDRLAGGGVALRVAGALVAAVLVAAFIFAEPITSLSTE